MKYLIPLLILFASCRTHKLITKDTRKADSVSVASRDSARVIEQSNSSDNLQAEDVHVEVHYGLPPKDTGGNASTRLPAKPVRTGNKVTDAIVNAIAAAGSAGQVPPTSVIIDIGKVSTASTTSSSRDSAGARVRDSAAVASSTTLSKKEVDRSIPWWVYLVAAGAVLYVSYRLNKRYALWAKLVKFFT